MKKKIVVISDTHGKHAKLKIPRSDILIHAGDFTCRGEYFEVLGFLEWFKDQPAEHKVYIAGNHELSLDPITRNRMNSGHTLPGMYINQGCNYLQNSQTIINGIKIYGTPYTPRFYDWAFNGDDTDVGEPSLRDIYSNIPHDTDILICHGPPFGMMDSCERDGRVGSKELLTAIEERPNLKLVCTGHIHECGGQTQQLGNTLIVNAASLGADYRTLNKMIVLDIEFNART